MAATIVRKIKNYLQLPKLTTVERDTYEQIRQEIYANPQTLSKITEKTNPIAGNYYDVAYCLDSNIKLVVAQHSSVMAVELPFSPKWAYPKNYGYDCYVVMPNGQSINLNDTKRAKLLLKTARHNEHIHNNQIKIDSFHGISEYIKTFQQKYNVHSI